MCDIHVIFTRHEDLGNCDTDGLYEIIEEKKPEVIFEELDYTRFNQAYIEQNFIRLEIKAITRYLENHIIEHIPIDTYDTPDFNEEKIFYYEDYIKENDNLYLELTQKRDMLAARDGFSFTNSQQLIEMTQMIKMQEDIFYRKTNNEEYRKIYEDYVKWYDNREYEMIKNICNYSKEHRYNKAIFIIGADHINSITKKIRETKEGQRNVHFIIDPKDLGFNVKDINIKPLLKLVSGQK